MSELGPDWVNVAELAQLQRSQPLGARVAGVDLVVVRDGDGARVLFGRCTHRHALLAEGSVSDGVLVCHRHGWDYDCHSGRSRCDPSESLQVFDCAVQGGAVWVDAAAVRRWRLATPVDFLDGELDP